jgi:hypothetical protein
MQSDGLTCALLLLLLLRNALCCRQDGDIGRGCAAVQVGCQKTGFFQQQQYM